jgi:hypothetical protein
MYLKCQLPLIETDTAARGSLDATERGVFPGCLAKGGMDGELTVVSQLNER